MSVVPLQASAVAAESQALQLRTLMEALGVKPGDTVAAKVTAQVSPTVARLDINGTPLEVRTPQPLPVGATLTFAVERQGQTLKLLLSELPRASQAAPQTALQTQPTPASQPQVKPQIQAPAVAQAAPPVPRGPVPPPTSQSPSPAGSAAPIPNPAPPARAAPLSAALPQPPAEGSAPSQGSVATAPSQPTAKPAPALPAATPQSAPAQPTAVPPQTIAAALVGLVARGLITQEAPEPLPSLPEESLSLHSTEAAKATEPPTRQPPKDPLAQPLREAMRQAAGRQESLGGLFANLSALASTKQPLPEPVLRAVATVLGFRLPAEAAATPQGLAQAVERSGTFLEARLAALPPGAPPPADLKAALGQLKAALAQWTETLPPDPAELPQDLQAQDPQPQDPQPQDLQARPPADRPPLRGALPQGQPPATPTLSRDAAPADIARILTDKTEAALARLTLVQAASLPEPRDLSRPDAPLQTTMEIPLRLGQETAMLQAQIRREPDDTPDDEPAPARAKARKAGAWSMRFSLEAEPIGPLHAEVRWQAGRVTVNLWAERDSTAAALNAARATLSDALEASAFTVEQLTIAAGRPADPREAPRRAPRLDRLS